MEYIQPYLNKAGIRVDTGLKYHRITGATNNKEYYVPENALVKSKSHGGHFAHCKHHQIEKASSDMDIPPIITCPYDTELFGHWWFEGPDFIYEFLKRSSENWTSYELTTPKKYLEKHTRVQCSSPSPSSWGEHGDYSVWINSSNDWIYKDLQEAAEKMIRLANSFKKPTSLQKRALNEAARELVLAESSDWPFIIKNNTSVQYAVNRLNTHIERFNKLYEQITKNTIDIKYLDKIESIDNIFPNMDYSIYKSF
ncbi:1,4-alpha-glucan branching enzyme [bioreactor metagenome]|uniref:1,4-alpha-glucan branching enzyme n=1 Tax=bioreactor metagenome TaxID=1076179 RepID=A0A645EMW4_9ZZZZ